MVHRIKEFYIIVVGFCLSFMSLSVFSQVPEIIIDSGIKTVYNANTLTVYGLDLSVIRLVNPSKIGSGYRIKDEYFSGWTSNFEVDYSKDKLRKVFSEEYFKYRVHQFQINQYLKCNEDNIVVEASELLSIDKIRDIVLDYSIEETEGIGFSIIVEQFHKRKEKVTTLFVFFDTQTKELLYVFRAFGDANGIGMRYHWETGIQEPLDKYLEFRYKKEFRKNKI